VAERQAMIDRSHALPLAWQAELLGISRGSVYYQPQPVSAADLTVMRRMDELHLDYPFVGSRMLRDLLLAEGFTVGRLHVSTLMKRMGLEALFRKPNTSKPAPGHHQDVVPRWQKPFDVQILV
jgi:putative transposase